MTEHRGPAGVDRPESQRDRGQSRASGSDPGVVSGELIEELEPTLLSFGEALGGDPSDTSDLPFFAAAPDDAMPTRATVDRDDAVLGHVRELLAGGDHVGLHSASGVGRTAVRGFLQGDLEDRPEFVVATLPDDAATTPRALYETVLQAGYDAGYGIDTGEYWQVADGVPWATDETIEAAGRMARRVADDDVSPVLICDDLGSLRSNLLDPLVTLADAGVRLFLTGSPGAWDRAGDLREALGARLRPYEGIRTFSPADVEAYVARSLALLGDEDPDEQDQSLFTRAAIENVHERTGGHPRAVRLECRGLFARAAFVWDRSTATADRIRVTPALRERDLTT